MSPSQDKPLLLLVDGHSLAFRSFYAFSKGGEGGLATKDGIPTSVTYGFLKALLDNCKSLQPTGVAIAFDTAEPTFRIVDQLRQFAVRYVCQKDLLVCRKCNLLRVVRPSHTAFKGSVFCQLPMTSTFNFVKPNVFIASSVGHVSQMFSVG